MSKIMTVHEVAESLQVHYNTIYELVKTGKIKSIRVGKQIRITEKFFNEFLDSESKNY